MIFFSKTLLILCLLLPLTACELLGMGGSIKIENDLVLIDLKTQIDELNGVLDGMDEHREKIAKFQKKEEKIETELKMAIQRELFEQVYWEKKIFEQLALRKVRLNQRILTLSSRKKAGLLTQELIDKDAKEHFQNKEINPIKKGWENRYKAAIDL